MDTLPRMRTPITLATVALALLAGLLTASTATAAKKPRVTLIGDSIQASFTYVPKAVRRLGAGYDLKVDAQVCRRLVAPSCPYNGSTPATALQVIQSKGKALGDTVVINVGYNDDPSSYRRDLDKTMRALRKAGVTSVVWVTLREERSSFATVNTQIRAGAKRWRKMMRVADWNRVSAGKPWFGSDGLHLNPKGALALSGLLRVNVRAAQKAARARTRARARARVLSPA